MEQTANEIQRLQSCINDLVSVLALPAIWSGHESSQIAGTLLDALLSMLRLDFTYARLGDAMDGAPLEALRLAQRRHLAAQPQEVGRALNHWLTGDPPTSSCVVPNPLGEGEVSIAIFRLGLQDDIGVVVAGSQRADFPTQIERLLLRVAVNQAAIGLQEARRLYEQRRAAEEIRFQAGVLDAVEQAVSATDIHGVITYWNRFAERLYGWSTPEVIGRNVMDITAAQGAQHAVAEVLSRLQRGARWTGECLVQHRDGTIFPALVTDSPIYNSQGVLIGVVRVSIDITERKRAEEELEQRVAERTRELATVNEELRKEILERKRSEQRLATQDAITRVLAEFNTLAAATPHLLQAIGESLEWEWGALWIVDRAAAVIRCQSIWHAQHMEAAEFDAISRKTAFAPGRALPGLVWQSAEPTWIDDTTQNPNYMRAPIAARVGLRGAIAFPILLSGHPLGVMEFFSRTVRQPDKEQLVMLSAIGSQIGQFIERKRVEEEQRKLASLVENSTDFIDIASSEGHALFVNPAGQKMVGLEGDEHVRATRMLDYIVEQERERFQKHVLPAVLRDGRWEGEIRLKHFKTGAATPMLHHVFVIKEPGSERRLALATISRDITARQRAEQALAHSAAQLKGLAEAALVVSSATSLNEILQTVADKARDIIGAHRSVIGTSVDKNWAQAVQAVSLSDKYAVYRDGDEKPNDSGIYALVCELNHPMRITQTELAAHPAWSVYGIYAEQHPLLRGWLAAPLVGSDGQNIGLLQLSDKYEGEFTAEDEAVTVQLAQMASVAVEKARLHASLAKSEAYLAEGQRLSHMGSWAWNVSSGELFWSQEHFRIFGLDPEKVKPSYPMLLQWIHPEDRSFLQESFERAIRDRRAYELDCRIVRPDGMMKHIHSWAHPVFNESGDLIEYVGTVIDTTERKHAEEALHRAQAELAHVTRVLTLGALTASIAHEVNQPLAAVITNGNACLRWLARETPDLDEARAAVERIIRDGNRASDVIRRIRALAKKTDLQTAWLDINDVIHEVIALVQREVRQHRVALRTELSAALPPVLGDRVQLQQVILNLLLNGIEAMYPVTDRPRELLIRSQRHASEEVLVAVQDSGIGLDPQSMAQLFDAFFTTKPAGMGMGLSISRSISEAHGGRLWASPNAGPGATFQFTLSTGGERGS